MDEKYSTTQLSPRAKERYSQGMFCRADGLKLVCRSTQRGQKGRARRAKRICFQGKVTWEYPCIFNIRATWGVTVCPFSMSTSPGATDRSTGWRDSASSPRRVSVRSSSIRVSGWRISSRIWKMTLFISMGRESFSISTQMVSGVGVMG